MFDQTLLIPLVFAEVPEKFKTNRTFKKLAPKLYTNYAKKFQKRLGTSVSWNYTPNNNVEFQLTNCTKTVKGHAYYREEITKYCLAQRHIFSYIGICYPSGKLMTIINKNHSVEAPLGKTPH